MTYGTPATNVPNAVLTLTYFSSTGTALAAPPTVAGSYEVVASYAGGADYLASATGKTAFTLPSAVARGTLPTSLTLGSSPTPLGEVAAAHDAAILSLFG